MSDAQVPMVSVGLPVYNAEATLPAAIESILSQSYTDFELIISDNASSDGTESICTHYESIDARVRVIRQPENMGAAKNFQFVFNSARGRYFMWAAADDTRTPGFIEKTLRILESQPHCVFSSSPNCFEGEEAEADKHERFELRGRLFQRLRDFLDNCWVSHACFYSLIRTDALRGSLDMSSGYLAADWAIIVHLLSKGEFARTSDELLVLGRAGESMQPDHIRKVRQKRREYCVPFYTFSAGFLQIVLRSEHLTRSEKAFLASKVASFNATVALMLARESIVSRIKRIAGAVTTESRFGRPV